MPIQSALLEWDQLLEIAQSKTAARRVRRLGQAPSTAPVATGDKPSASLRLYRDSNSWCPYCERVWFALEEKSLPFETEFIDLQNKPDWYISIVSTGLVPAATIAGQLIYESKSILLELERFEPALLPEDPAENAVLRQWIEDAAINSAAIDDYTLLRKTAPEAMEAAKLAVADQLDQLEQMLAQYPGPYFGSTFSLVDIMYSPLLDRLAANLPVYWDYKLKGNSRFPRLNAWFEALSQRPAYQRVRSDEATNNLLMRRRYGLEPIGNPLPLNPADYQAVHYRAEAAERLSDNREAAIGDVLRNSGVDALSVEGSSVAAIVELHLKTLTDYLLHGDNAPQLGGQTGRQAGHSLDPAIAAIGAVTLAYLRNRVCAPRDLSAGAATAFRHAADRVLASLY